MKKQGCEIEAIGINYTIYTHKRETPFSFFSRKQHHKCIKGVQELEKGDTNNNPKSIRHVLKDVNCRAKTGEILAIVGPSGAGKSTFLEVLAGKIEPQSGSIFVNQKPVDKARFKKISGYVTQKDTLFPLLTVEETLSFSAKLRLKLAPKELSSRVKCLIQELGLEHVAGARIGDDRIRGISGGERRRVSIGVELIHDPGVLILDEPTSGLDSTSALQIIDMLKTMAVTRDRTIILSIHQPCFRIMKLFNSILLLANGTILHHGTIEQLSLRLILLGLDLPFHVNILEFAIESIDIIQKQNHTLLPQSALMIKNSDDLVGAQARVGLFAFILTYLLSSTTEALPIFLQEREILMKETSCGSYRVSSYVIANSLVYLPFLLILALLFSTPLYWMCLQYMFGMCLASGEQVLKEEGYGGEESRRKNLLIMMN
ncbi:hypothetical protein KY285_024730 [Solanum tuberosum]|nr:hypothetical protein KY284_024699 [Solanum tuberosum]KAH0676929.1 hypothetical protein KY285_024730 [Solanum tuberosum]